MKLVNDSFVFALVFQKKPENSTEYFTNINIVSNVRAQQRHDLLGKEWVCVLLGLLGFQ